MKDKITSPQNTRIKGVKKLLEKASARREAGLFVTEGLREAVLARRAGYEIQEVFVCEEILKADKAYPYEEVIAGVHDVYELSREAYNALAYRETTEGIIATIKTKQHALGALTLSALPLILVIESAEKPGNLGAMLRTCDAVGVDAVIICDPRTDIYNPNTVRSSVGTVFTNQIAIGETGEAIAYLKKSGVTTMAAELNATENYSQQDLNKPVAIVVGAEATGLSEEWIRSADRCIRIPMNGKIDSLNVSVSAAVLLYEALRQRNQ